MSTQRMPRKSAQISQFPNATPRTPHTFDPHRGIHLLPNAVTAGAAFCGFYAILLAIQGRFLAAIFSVLASCVLDALDGRLARMTNSQSDFGAQFDSLSDMVSFGVAPAVLAWQYTLHSNGRLGVFVAFFYCACAALRLARFNTNLKVVSSEFFQGLPSPSAAALVCGVIWLTIHQDLAPRAGWSWMLLGVCLFAGFSMVTSAPYYSFKDWNRGRGVRFATLVAFVTVLGLVFFEPRLLLVGVVGYALSGYILYTIRLLQARRKAV